MRGRSSRVHAGRHRGSSVRTRATCAGEVRPRRVVVPNYFATARVTDVWQVDGAAVEVEFYHRPIGAMFGALRAAGFRVDEIVEPSPLPRVEGLDRRAYELLTTAPRFLYFRAVKAGTAGER